MSRYDYLASMELSLSDQPFYGLIMAAMRKADNTNEAKLRHAWPDVWHELQARYNAPGGYIAGDPRPPTETDQQGDTK